jgi:hypothetical protein
MSVEIRRREGRSGGGADAEKGLAAAQTPGWGRLLTVVLLQVEDVSGLLVRGRRGWVPAIPGGAPHEVVCGLDDPTVDEFYLLRHHRHTDTDTHMNTTHCALSRGGAMIVRSWLAESVQC